MMAAMAATQEPMPMNDGRPKRQQRRPTEVTRSMPRPSHSKYTRHQGKKECARRLRQMAGAA
jgi:hypothetical protein